MRWVASIGILLLACGGEQFATDSSGGSGGHGGGATGGTAGGSTGGSGATAASGGTGAVGAQGGAGGGLAGTAGAGGVVATGCPESAPDLSSSCTPGVKCSYGADIRPTCRTRYECEFGSWVKTPTNCPPLVRCESLSILPVVGAPCGATGEWCVWDSNLVCGCVPCTDANCATSQIWDCRPAPGDPCPSVAPDFGQPCELPSGECEYGFCPLDFHFVATCPGGVWRVDMPTCPSP